MSDESSKNTVDLAYLERQIGNLRTAIVILVVVVATLFGYIIIQPYLLNPYFFLNPILILPLIGLGFLLLVACLSANDKR
jgi:hypothetical protein